ncbi:MAG: NifB/NifX family molybdenum-iron cluster-binding protein [Clostridia bacterium]|nr:NifB/NifX family molybdenum-iron cluster-binding protein [Clostridia bacterium]MDD4798815.1 NifB/NifX family molybdenum-iron cluster-binding protein [Clostridia bacterium]
MLIAVAAKDGALTDFENADVFELYQIENDQQSFFKQVTANVKGIGALAGFLKTVSADVLIAKSITPAAKAVLDMVRIMPVQGDIDSAEAAVSALLTGRLKPMTCQEHADCSNCGKHDGGHCGRH